jgi:hypothetical protein
MDDTRERRGEDVRGVSNLPVRIGAIARPGLLRRVRRCVSFSKSKGSAAGLN